MFVPRTVFPDYRVLLAHYKGHQSKAIKRMGELSPQINLVLELRDSRCPISSNNQILENIFRSKDRIIIYTKKDMFTIPKSLLNKWHEPRNEKFISIDTNRKSDVLNIIKLLKDYHNKLYPQPPLGLRLMITGMPNVGKSTLVNQLRKFGFNNNESFKKVAQTGNMPGVTRNTSEIIRISREPEILLYDTPGVTLPHLNDIKTVLSLYLIGTLNHNEIDPIIAADYLLYIVNLSNNKSDKVFKKYLKTPTNDIYELLTAVSKKMKNAGKIGKNWKPNYLGSAITLIQEYRMGKLGKICMDENVLRGISSEEFNDSIIEENTRIQGMLNESTSSTSKTSNKPSKPSKPSKRERLVKQSNQLFV